MPTAAISAVAGSHVLGGLVLGGVVGGPTTVTVVLSALAVTGVVVAALTRGHPALATGASERAPTRGADPAPAPPFARATEAVLPRRAPTASDAVVFVAPDHGPAVAAALEAIGVHPLVAADPAGTLAAVVRGASLLVVDPTRPETASLVRTVRRRVDDGWSDCSVVACVAPWQAIDDELSSLVDALARYPVSAGELDLSVRVARAQHHDPPRAADPHRPPVAPAPRPA
jgi:hypothetical protein